MVFNCTQLVNPQKKKTDKPQFVVGDYPHLPCINVKDLVFLGETEIGSGSQAKVYKVHTKMIGTCAYKQFSMPIDLSINTLSGERANPTVKDADEGEEKYLIREITYSLEVNCHPNIIVVHAYASEFDDEAKPIRHNGILMEFMENGPLSKYLYSYNGRYWEKPEVETSEWSTDRVEKWALQIARALAFCHESFKLIHRDVKPQNILLSANFEVAKLADFGIARRQKKTDEPLTSGKGTKTFMAPEVFNPHGEPTKYDFSADVFSYGCLLYALTTQKGPFEEMASENKSLTKFFDFIKDEKNRPDLSTDPQYKKLNEIIKNCWRTDPKKRYTMEKIVRELDLSVKN